MSKRLEEERRMVTFKETLWLPEDTSPVMIAVDKVKFQFILLSYPAKKFCYADDNVDIKTRRYGLEFEMK